MYEIGALTTAIGLGPPKFLPLSFPLRDPLVRNSQSLLSIQNASLQRVGLSMPPENLKGNARLPLIVAKHPAWRDQPKTCAYCERNTPH